MSDTIVEIQLPENALTPVLHVHSLTDDTASLNGGDALTQLTNVKGFWRATVTQDLAGVYRVVVIDSDGDVIATGYVALQNDTETYRVEDTYSGAAAAGGDTAAINDIKAKTDQLKFTSGRVHSVLADSDGVSETKFREIMTAFVLNPSEVSVVSGDTRQVVYKKRDGITTVATVTFDYSNGSRSAAVLA
jgi:hypothetical protein